MFEFLKECDTKLYDAGRELENQLNSKFAFVAMRSLIEYALNTLYESYGNDLYNVTLNDLLHDDDFKDQVKHDLGFKNFDRVDEICRLGGNRAIHIKRQYVFSWTPEDTEKGVKCVYDFSRCFYKYKTGKIAPEWSLEEYKNILNASPDPEARRKIEAEYSQKLNAKEAELAAVKLEVKTKTLEKKKAEDELELLKRSSIDATVLNSYETEIAKLKDLSNSREAELVRIKSDKEEAERQQNIAQSKLSEIEIQISRRENYTKELEEQLAIQQSKYKRQLEDTTDKIQDLSKKNDELRLHYKEAQERRQELEKQLADQELNAVDSVKLNELTKEVELAQKAEAEARQRMQGLQTEVESLNDKLYMSKNMVDSVYHKYCAAKKEASELWDANEQLKETAESLKTEINNISAPLCLNCRTPLRVQRRKDGTGVFWSCIHYKESAACKRSTRDILPSEKAMVDRILVLQGEKEATWAEFNNNKAKQSMLLKQGFRVDQRQIERLKRKTIAFDKYPASVAVSLPRTYWFESLEVPAELFEQREEFLLNYFSRFKLICSKMPQKVPENYLPIYSLALKLLNRGIVTPSETSVEETLREKFYTDDFGVVNSLFDDVFYHHPLNNYKNEYEQRFAEEVFSKVLGPSWATYVQVHIAMDILLPSDDWNNFVGQDVDFYFERNGKKIVIDFCNKPYDTTARDSRLKSYGYQVVVFDENVIKTNFDQAVSLLKELLGENRAKPKDIECNDKFALSCKLVHQISIALVKALEQGFININSNIHIDGSLTSFSNSELEYLLAISETQVQSIIRNFALIYDVDLFVSFHNDSEPAFRISIGEGNEESDIIIRDLYVPFNYLCEINPISLKWLPKIIDKKAITYFLKFLFGFDSFRDGQFEALKRLLLREDSIVLLPTGAGKSIIYQLAGFLFPGAVVVISPLNSLIEDQISNLQLRNGINNIVSITSINSSPDVQKQLTAALMGHNSTSLLYISPERLQIPSFRQSVDTLLANNNICAVAIDEAHCVSEWGHEFRSAYLNVGKTARSLFKKGNYVPPILALTGTASDAVLADVQRDLGILGDESLILPRSFDREELSFNIVPCTAESKTSMIARLLKKELPQIFNKNYDDFSKRNGAETDSGIIFTPLAAPSRPTEYDASSMCSRLTGMFPELGIGCYFSSTPEGYDDESWKTTISDYAKRFKENDINLIVATKAYGMGIDKSNIRFTIHDGLPTSIEQFYQEAGRAGRDRKSSECLLLFSNDNDQLNEQMLNPALSITELLERYQDYDNKIKSRGWDDLSSVLFFHVNNFKGAKQECDLLEQIVGQLQELQPEPGKKVSLLIMKREDQTKDDAQNEWIRAMIRFATLGIISDYTYDYSTGRFEILFGDYSKSEIIYHYREYVSIIEKGKAKTETDKLESSNLSEWEFIKFALQTLVEYIYDKIEGARRQALRSMFQLAKQAAACEESQRDDFIRQEIMNYLELKTETRDELQIVRDAEHVGWREIERMFPFSLNYIATDEEKTKSHNLKGAIGRMIESNSDHPGLILLRAITEIKSGVYESGLVANDICASIRFALDRYSIDEADCKDMLFKMLNLTLNADPIIFEKTIEQMKVIKLFVGTDIVGSMLASSLISDSNRDYIAIKYVLESVYERM